MNILYTFNDRFVPQVAAAITSVCENNKEENDITFYLFVLEVSNENKEQMERYIQSYQRNTVFIELQNLQDYFDFEIDTTGWNPIVLARLLLDKLLPENIDRILYLDGDTIVRGSLHNMYHIDMKDHVIAAGLEPTYSREHKKDIDMENFPYYNAGVLLIDLNNWRNQKTGEQILDFYGKHNGKLFSNDQDAINGTLKGQILTLEPKYNYFNVFDQYSYSFLNSLCDYPYVDKTAFQESKNNPVIIHYLGEERPWRIGNHHRFRGDYLKYLKLTPWSGEGFEKGWNLYFFCWNCFNLLTKPFPGIRYKIITALIPKFLEYRAKKK